MIRSVVPSGLLARSAVVAFVLFMTPCLRAVERHVPSRYPTIQAAIDACVGGGEVVIAPGVYTGDGNRDITTSTYGISVRSSNPLDPAVVAATIIDLQGSESEPHCGFIPTAHFAVSGLTIINGWAASGDVVVSTGGELMVDHCVLTNNTAVHGSLIGARGDYRLTMSHCTLMHNTVSIATTYTVDATDAYISDCLISENTGAGIHVFRFCQITSCTISRNSGIGIYASPYSWIESTIADSTIAGNLGGGVSVDGASVIRCRITGNRTGVIPGDRDSSLEDCEIAYNESSGDGGGVYCNGTTGSITNCRIVGNTAGGRGGGVFGTWGARIDRCTISGNTANDYGGGVWGNDFVISNSIISDNAVVGAGGCGGGISTDMGVTISNCTLTGNIGEDAGGALHVRMDGEITTIANCVL